MSNKTSPQRLLTNPSKVCKCKRWFSPSNHNRLYCKPECKKKYGGRAIYDKNRLEYNREHPEICPQCGCNTSKEQFRYCEECRLKHRQYPSYKKILRPKPDTASNLV